MRFLISILLCINTAWATESVFVLNTTNNRVEHAVNPDQVRGIASITKLMTAMVALDTDRDLDKKLKLTRRVAGHLPVQEYTRRQLLEAMLIKSDNAAAETLAEDYPGGRAQFIQRMNWYSQIWDMPNTKFSDASGLSAFNVSTARETAELVNIASSYWLIREISTKKQADIETRYKKKVRKIKLSHTSGSILEFDNVLVSKTGLTTAAGWCVGLAVEKQKQGYVIVILGSKNKTQRLNTVRDILYNHIVDTNIISPEKFAN